MAVLWMQAALAQAPPAAWEKPLAERRWEEAEPLLKNALNASETAPALRGMATVYRATGRLTDADPLLEKLVRIEETVQNIEELASIKAALGELERAEALYRRSLELRSRADEDELRSIPTHQRLAQVELSSSRFRDAEHEAEVAVVIRTRKLGADHADSAGDFAILANIYQAEKKFTEAAITWDWVLRIQEAAFGIDDLRLAATLDSLSACRRELKQWRLAEAPLRRAIAIREINQGPLNGDVAQTIDTLARLLFANKRFEEAEPLFRRSLEIWTHVLGPTNSVLALSYDNLAVTEAALKKYDEAEKLYLEAMKLRDDDDVISLRNLALVRVAKENYKDAEPLFKRALAALDAPYNRASGQLGELLGDYAAVLRQLGRPAEAAKLDARRKALQSPVAALPLRSDR